MTTTILDTLITQAKSALSRSFLLTGVLPALALLAGWRLYTRGAGELRNGLAALLGSAPSQLTADALFVSAVVAAVAGIFFIGRSAAVRVLQTLPGPLLRPLREMLLDAKRREWRQLEERCRDAEVLQTPVFWAMNGSFEPKSAVRASGPEAIERARSASAAARTHIETKLRHEDGEVSSLDCYEVANGLTGLFSLPPEDPAWQSESTAWKTLYTEPAARRLVEAVHASLFRVTVDATRAKGRYPGGAEWIEPTHLGNRAAVLDDYADRRYGIATSTLWARLWGLLDEKDRAAVADAQLALETLANLTIASWLLASGVLLHAGLASVRATRPGVDGPGLLGPAVFASVCVLLALLLNRSAVLAFDGVAEHITRLVDLHRIKLITAVGYKAPATVSEETAAFEELNTFFEGAGPRHPARPLTPAERTRVTARPE